MKREPKRLHRKWGLRLWAGVPISLGPELEPHFSCRLYGVGLRHFPLIIGAVWWGDAPKPARAAS